MDITKYKYNKYKLKYKLLKEQIMAGGNPEDEDEDEDEDAVKERFEEIYTRLQLYYRDNIVKRYTTFKWFVTVQTKDIGVCLKKKIIDNNFDYSSKPSSGIYFSPNFLTLEEKKYRWDNGNIWTHDTTNWIEWCIYNSFSLSKYDPNTSSITAIGIHYNNFVTYKNKKFVYLASDTDVPDDTRTRTFIYTINSQESLLYFLRKYGNNSQYSEILIKWKDVSEMFGGIDIKRIDTMRDFDELSTREQRRWIANYDVDQLIIWSKNTYTLCLNLSANSPYLITPETNPDIGTGTGTPDLSI
jgi:hypothetical protein